MISMPLEQSIAKIKEKTSLSEEEINNKINNKLDQLSGLVSKEGAAYIIANELGVKLFEQVSGKLQIKNILSGMRDVETIGKVIKKFDIREFNVNGRAGKVCSLMIGDETGTIRVVCWGAKAEEIANLSEGAIIRIKSGYVKENNGMKEVHMNDKSLITVNPQGVNIGEVAQTIAEKPEAIRKNISELQENSSNVELFGTVVQSFEPRFFEVDPSTGRRIKAEDGVFKNQEGKEVQPDYSYVMNVVLDDGTETIRAVFFRDQAEKLVSKSKEEMLTYRNNIQEFETVKKELLGKQIKITGRVNKNQMFDRLEFMTNDVDINPDPKKEIERLDQEEDPVQKNQDEIRTEVEKIN
jgi:replication factor A1